ncbi:hypothetical protein H6F90_05445 [Trichocoleus sp. FACHB-591]|uniref:ELWxxDGT repeat protein n=1 Tax=Trichocoleus sp. FACHB-591 TaxID=2692872 RepID=UPI001688B3CE|nr:ELWxxDGT repeat protein [Trichocoleus sp. FACHB-591]MBD2094595.1 hypothetical protein [Trichocoleus sp. FACHB-591]
MPASLFDANFYRAFNPDLAGLTDEQASSHFLTYGLSEGRIFSPFVNLQFYQARNPDLAAAGLTSNQQLFQHLQDFGVAEGRAFSPFLDLDFYLANNPDVNQAFAGNREQALQHLQTYGLSEARIFSPFVDLNFYLANNPDVAAFYGNNRFGVLQHLQMYGVNEGRAFSPFVDLNFYLANNPDVNQAFAGDRHLALQHLQTYGLNESRKFTPFFDLNYYKANNPDLIDAGLNNTQLLQHFQMYGLRENRVFAPAFDLNYYRSLNPDLVAAGLDERGIYEHFQRYGLAEGRLASPNFDVQVYLANNLDLISAGFNYQQAYEHYLAFGQGEGRPGSDYAGSSEASARAIALGSTSLSLTDFVGPSDSSDWYEFTLSTAQEWRQSLSFTGGGGGVSLKLAQDANNNGVVDEDEVLQILTTTSDTVVPDFVETLAPGTYYLQVAPATEYTYINYNLNLSVTPAPNPVPATASIQGTKWSDRNGDGIQNTDEPGLAGWTIYLDQNQNNQLDTNELSTTTDANGDYSFVALAAGVYTVAEVPQAGWGQTFPSTRPTDQTLLIPITNHNDLIFDPKRNYLYITTDDGDLERFDVATRTLLTPFDVGNSLIGGDITADGSAVYVAEGEQGAAQGFIRKVNLNDGTVANLIFDLNNDDLPSDVAIGSNGLGIVRSFGEWGPLRQLDLSTDTITSRTDIWSYHGGAQITRSADRSLLFITQDGISSGPISTYDAVTNQISTEKWTNGFLGSSLSAVNQNGSLIALESGNGVSILDKNLTGVEILSGVDSGVAFDSVRDVLYAASSATDQIIAFNTQTWKELYRLNIGEDIAPDYYGHNSVPYGNGMMTVSDDGQFLFMSTASGVRMFNLGRPGTYTVSLSTDQIVENINFAANAIPTLSVNQGITLNEGDSVTLTESQLQVMDTDHSATQLTYTLKEAPANGALELNGVALSTNQTFTQDDIDSDRLSYTHNGNPVTSDRFSFSVVDAAGNALSDNSFEIAVNSVNDAPVITNNAERAVRLGQTVTISNFSLFVTDEESLASQIIYTLNQLPTNGILKLNNASLSTGQTFTQDDINNGGLSYQNTSGEAGSDRFDFSVTDGMTTLTSSFDLEVVDSGGLPSVVRDINPGASSSFSYGLTNVNGMLYFIAGYGTVSGLWKSDGTAVGTTPVKPFQNGWHGPTLSNLTNANGTLYFTATDYSSGHKLWKSDGTADGTVPFDIFLGFGSAAPARLTNVNNTLYFTADDGAHGTEVWKSDGTLAGTTLVKDISVGTSASQPDFLTNVNGTLYFTAYTPTAGTELWKGDGTAGGTTLVKDINIGTDSSFLTNFVNVNGTLYFTAYTPTAGTELWKSDGTAGGTTLVKDINPGAGGSAQSNFTNVDGTLYFTVNDGTHGTELWKSDGTAGGTTLVKDINPGVGGSAPSNLTNVDGTLYFTADDGINGKELWKSDGTIAGTTLLKDINAGPASSTPYSSVGFNDGNFVNVDGILYFTAYNSIEGTELWRSDGTTAGTTLVKDIYGGLSGSSPASLTNVNGTLYFVADDGINGRELWAL